MYQRALGGVGFIIVEATAIEPKGRISSNDLGLWDDSLIEKHKQLNKDIHSFGAKLQFKLLMQGRKSTVIDSTPIAPSSIAFQKRLHLKFKRSFNRRDKNIKKIIYKCSF